MFDLRSAGQETRREIGIRFALGAARRDALRLVMRQGMTMVGVGVVMGLGSALL